MELDFRKTPAVLEHIVDTMLAGMFTVDSMGRFVAWNRGAERITDYLAKDLIGQPCSLLEGPNCKGFAALRDLLRETTELPTGMCNQDIPLLIEHFIRQICQAKNRSANAAAIEDVARDTLGRVERLSQASCLCHDKT